MTRELLIDLLQANLAAGAMILLALALRRPARRLFGAEAAYGLWALAPLAAIASLLPPRTAPPLPPLAATAMPASPTGGAAVLTERATVIASQAALDPWTVGALVWALGVLAMALWFAHRQSAFLADIRRGLAGPAVVGFLRPRIVTPDDFHQRFTPREQAVVLAHEQAHLARQDSRINTLSALMRAVCWFNPLVHVADHYLRIDQELACDAAVVERDPKARRPYAEALLKAQLAARPLPFGCYWPSRSQHPLTERIVMLSQEHPRRLRLAGGVLISALSVAAGYAAWAAQPAEVASPVRTSAPPAALGAAAPRQVMAQAAPTRTLPSRPVQATSAQPVSIALSPTPPQEPPAAVLAQAATTRPPLLNRNGEPITLDPGAYILPNRNFLKLGPDGTYFYALPEATVNLGTVTSSVRIKVTLEVDRENGVGIERYQPKLMEAVLVAVSAQNAGSLTGRDGIARVKGSLKDAIGQVVAPLTIKDIIIEEMHVSSTSTRI